MKKEATGPSAKTESVPAQTGWALIWRHLRNWTEIYLWVPIALLSIWLFAQFAYFLTGRRPQENVDWIVGISGGLVKLVFIIVFISVDRQQTGVWLTKEEQTIYPDLARIQAVTKCVLAIVAAYILSH